MRRILCIIFMTGVLIGCATPGKKIEVEETVFYPPLPQKPKIQFLTSITDQEDIGEKQSSFEKFLLGELPPMKMIRRPYDVASAKDKIYVLDRETKSLIFIDLKKRIFDHLKAASGKLPNPSGIWVSEDDYVYITDHDLKQVLVFNADKKFARSYGKGILDKPLDVVVYNDKVYVCDFNLHEVIVFDKDSGDVVERLGELGAEEGQFLKPTHVSVDHEGNLYVNDALNFRIQKFDQFGTFLRTFGYHGDSVGGFARPKGIAISREGHLYAVDTAFENVQIFDAESGDVYLYFGGFGRGPGDMYLPAGIHIDYENLEYFQKYADKNFHLKYLIYVANQYGPHKLSVYGFGEWTGK